MSEEWMQVVTCPKPCLLTRPIASVLDENDKLQPIRGNSSPSLITLLGETPSWLRLHKTKPNHSFSATLTAVCLASQFLCLINHVDLIYQAAHVNKLVDMNTKTRFDLKKQTPDKILRQISHIMSDIIIFNVNTIEDAANEVMNWVHSCCKLEGKLDKPFACIFVRNYKTIDDIETQFNIACLKSRNADEITERDIEVTFRSRKLLIAGPEHGQQDVIVEYLKIARSLRIKRQHMWSLATYQNLHNRLIGFLIDGQKELNWVKILCSFEKIQKLSSVLWPELLGKKYASNHFSKFIIPVLSGCFARYILKSDHSEYLSKLHEKLLIFQCLLLVNLSNIWDQNYVKTYSPRKNCQKA